MSALPEPWRDLVTELRKIKEQVRRLSNASPFFGTGVHPNGSQGLDSDNYVAGASGFSLNGGTGNAEFNDITLRDLPNSMLANPLEPARVHTDAQNFAVPAASSGYSTIASVAITVPDGFTRMLVMSQNANATAFNSTASSDFLYVRGRINASDSGGFVLGSSSVAAGDYGVALDFQTRLLSGLTPGDAVTFALQVQSAFAAWSTNTANAANLDAAMLWLR